MEGRAEGYIPEGAESFRIEKQDIGPESAETLPIERFGCNVTIKNYWNRHAQKQSGQVMAKEGGASTSLISEKGASSSHDAGAEIEGSANGTKGYATRVLRTGETLENMLEGYQEANPDKPVRDILVQDNLLPNYSGDFMALYDKKFTDSREKVMTEMNLDPSAFNELDPDAQEQIAERAEEPVIREWLRAGELHNMLDPRLAANIFARAFDRHTNRMSGKLYSGSEIDLIHVTHKGVMEPFLISGVLIRTSDGKTISNIDELGGSMAVLEGWQSETKTDGEGKPITTIEVRGEKYIVNQQVLKDLVKGDPTKEAIAFDQIKDMPDAKLLIGLSQNSANFAQEVSDRFSQDPDRLTQAIISAFTVKESPSHSDANVPTRNYLHRGELLAIGMMALENPDGATDTLDNLEPNLHIEKTKVLRDLAGQLLFRGMFDLAENDDQLRNGADLVIENFVKENLLSSSANELLARVSEKSKTVALEVADKLIPLYNRDRNTRKFIEQKKKQLQRQVR